MVEVEVVDCDCIFVMALMRFLGPAQYPTRHPVMLYAFESPLRMSVLSLSWGATATRVVNLKLS